MSTTRVTCRMCKYTIRAAGFEEGQYGNCKLNSTIVCNLDYYRICENFISNGRLENTKEQIANFIASSIEEKLDLLFTLNILHVQNIDPGFYLKWLKKSNELLMPVVSHSEAEKKTDK